jgi:predicted nuclease with TOPRIM domain
VLSAEEVTPVDHQIFHAGGSTSTLDRLPSRLQLSKSQKSLSLRDEMEELAYENSYLKAELTWNQETRQVLMQLHERTSEVASALSEVLTEATAQLRRCEERYLELWGIAPGSRIPDGMI